MGKPRTRVALTWEGHHVAVPEGTHSGDVVRTRWNSLETVMKLYPKTEHPQLEPQDETLE